MAKWGEIKCPRCAAPPISLWDALARSLEEGDAREARLEAKLAQQDDLVQAAVAAREAQKAYFKDRSRDNLIASKQAEAALDKMLAAIREGGE